MLLTAKPMRRPIREVLVDKDGEISTMMMAAKRGYIEIVRELLNYRTIEVDYMSNCGWTALRLATRNGHVEIAKMLFETGGL